MMFLKYFLRVNLKQKEKRKKMILGSQDFYSGRGVIECLWPSFPIPMAFLSIQSAKQRRGAIPPTELIRPSACHGKKLIWLQ